ncbi:hypothetical protein NA57DRAFT_75536 [Rhizodiscina lignyota]|uniref:Uncharacterized protein n=1 Tax=Rhizodiscina lignyota TaxID=1504668 RepID=A0A9P4M749_9PEZI|nr:hypothetical protein NA57DRAFT_75536 [Rhizodiscina lignyota]
MKVESSPRLRPMRLLLQHLFSQRDAAHPIEPSASWATPQWQSGDVHIPQTFVTVTSGAVAHVTNIPVFQSFYVHQDPPTTSVSRSVSTSLQAATATATLPYSGPLVDPGPDATPVVPHGNDHMPKHLAPTTSWYLADYTDEHIRPMQTAAGHDPGSNSHVPKVAIPIQPIEG